MGSPTLGETERVRRIQDKNAPKSYAGGLPASHECATCLALRQDFEQVANLPLLEEGMPQGKLRLDLVAVPPALPLARHVALVD